MATRDTAQLILEVDARIATAQRAVNQLARSIQQDAAGMDNGLKKVEQSGERVARSLGQISGRTRSGFTQLSFQIGDVTQGLAMGTKASTIFAQQSGQVIQALQIMGGEGNKFLQFLGGPWGLAISTAGVILATLASKLFDTGDSVGQLVEKMRQQAKQADRTKAADEAWLRTYEGASANIDKLVDALDEENRSLAENTRLKQKQLQSNVATLQDQRAGLVRQLTEQQQRLGKLRGPARGGFSDPETTRQNIADAQANIGRISQQIDQLDARIDKAQRGVREAGFEQATVEAKALADPIAGINKRYDDMASAAKRAAAGNDALAASLSKTLAQIERQRAAALKAARPDSADDRQSGRQVSFAEATSIARAAGLQVNSGFRQQFGHGTPAHRTQEDLFNDPGVNRPGNPVARPGTSAHGGANGKWAIDIQITDGVTPGKIRKIFADQGVSLTKVLKEKGHFHVEGSRSEAAAADKAQETEASKAQDRQQAFQSEMDRLNAAILQARSQLVHGVDAEADQAIKQLQLEQEDYGRALDRQVSDKKLNAADAEILKAKYASLTFEKAKAIEIQRSLQRMQQSDEAEQRRFQYSIDDLRFADEMATTQSEHRRIQLEILDVVYQQKEAHLKALKAELELAGKIEEAAAVQAQIDRLPTERAQDQQRVNKGTMNPLEAWAKDIPKTAAEINEALQSIEAQGLDNLSSAITDVITGTKSLKDAFSDVAKSIIADLIRMSVRMLIFRAISGIFGSGGSAGGPISINAGTSSFFSSARNPFGGFRASGGPVSPDRSYIVGERGPEVFVPNRSGTIVPAAPKLRLAGAANSNGGDTYTINQTIAPNFAGNAATKQDLLQMGLLAKEAAIDAIRQKSRRSGRP